MSRSRVVQATVLAAILLLIVALVVAVVWLRGDHSGAGNGSPDGSASGAASGSLAGGSSTPAATAPPSGTASSASTPTAVPTPAPSSVPPEAQQSLAQQAQSQAASATTFTIATFNVLGASHTTERGDSRIKRPYGVRLRYALQVIAAHQADVVGFQEFESPQARLFTKLLGAQWELWPAVGGSGADGRNSIAYRKKKWELVKGSSLTIPYFNGGSFHSPMALLRDRATGQEVWFINVHNPATGCAVCDGNNDRWRHQAVRREIRAIKELSADGTPVVLAGDMNSKGAFYCDIVDSGLGMTFPNPGSGTGASCVGPRPGTIDWILGTHTISWSGYVRDRGRLSRLATDHPAFFATAAVGSGQNQ